MAAMLLTVISLLGVPPGQEADPGITWETVAGQVLEESPETAARTLLDWAEAGASAPPQEVGALLEARTETTAEAAASFAAVLDAADGLRAAGEGPALPCILSSPGFWRRKPRPGGRRHPPGRRSCQLLTASGVTARCRSC